MGRRYAAEMLPRPRAGQRHGVTDCDLPAPWAPAGFLHPVRERCAIDGSEVTFLHPVTELGADIAEDVAVRHRVKARGASTSRPVTG